MPAAQRRTSPGVIARLLAAPQAFEFVQAVTLLLAWLEEAGVAPGPALRGRIRFENSLRLGFPPSEIEALRVEPAAGAAEPDGVEDPAGLLFRLTPGFMGLLGVHGALPAHETERIAAWQAAWHDEAPRAFLDLFSSRMLALYYEASCKHRVEHQAGREHDGFRARLLALAGAGENGSGAMPDALAACLAGMLQQRPRSAPLLARLLAHHFGLPVAVEEAVGHWSRMTPQEQSALGRDACLGQNTLLGARSWRPDLRARLRIGPLGRDAFERLLPSGDMAASLRRILAALALPGIDFEVCLVLRAGEVAPSRLAGGAAAPARLGRDSFVVSGAVQADRADMRYLVRTMAPLAPAHDGSSGARPSLTSGPGR